jgi:hypothetical protein
MTQHHGITHLSRSIASKFLATNACIPFPRKSLQAFMASAGEVDLAAMLANVDA